MRSALIIATFALTVLAAPVPEARLNLNDARDVAVETHLVQARSVEKVPFQLRSEDDEQYEDEEVDVRSVRGKETRDVEPSIGGKESRGIRYGKESGPIRGKGTRDAEPSIGGKESRGIRYGKESGPIRGKGTRNAEPSTRIQSRWSTWSSGLIEALKTRGFSSITLLNERQPN